MVYDKNLELTEISIYDNEDEKKLYSPHRKLYISPPPPTLNSVYQEYINNCNIKFKEHLYASKYYDNLYVLFSTIILVLGSINTFLATINVLFNQIKPLSISVAACIAGYTILFQVQQKLKYNIQSTNHLNCANQYSSLQRKIELQLISGPTETALSSFNMEFTKIAMIEVLIPNFIEKKYGFVEN